jgi:hypothetical protein
MLVSQIIIIIYKNTRFFSYVVSELQGRYQQLVEMAYSDKVIMRSTVNALNFSDIDLVDTIFKMISWADLFIICIILALATIVILLKKRVKVLEVALLVTGLFYLLLGVITNNIGIRALQLIGLVPAFFLVDFLSLQVKFHKALQLALVVSLLLFPITIARGINNTQSYIVPSDLNFKGFIEALSESDQKSYTRLSEHDILSLTSQSGSITITPRKIFYRQQLICKGNLMVFNSSDLHTDLYNISSQIEYNLQSLLTESSLIYDDGSLSINLITHCDSLSLQSLK